jgi:hypothetical protein
MLSRQERKQLNTEFYTALGLMMQGSFSVSGRRVKWTNFKTGVRDVYLRMEVDGNGARIALDLQHRDLEIRELFWEQLLELKALLQAEWGTDLLWEESYTKPDGTTVCRVEKQLNQGNLFNKTTWPLLLTFLKENLLAFDRFWADAFDIFKNLEA